MAKTIQLVRVSEALYRELRARAVLEGMSLSDFLIREFRKLAEQPTIDELRARLETLRPMSLKISPTKALREQRDCRCRGMVLTEAILSPSDVPNTRRLFAACSSTTRRKMVQGCHAGLMLSVDQTQIIRRRDNVSG